MPVSGAGSLARDSAFTPPGGVAARVPSLLRAEGGAGPGDSTNIVNHWLLVSHYFSPSLLMMICVSIVFVRKTLK